MAAPAAALPPQALSLPCHSAHPFQPVSGHLVPTFRVIPSCICSFPKLSVTSTVGTQVCAQAAPRPQCFGGGGQQHRLGQGRPPWGNVSGGQPSGPGRGVLLPAPTTPPAKAKTREGWGVGGGLGAAGAQRLLQGQVGSGCCLKRSWLSLVVCSQEMGTRHQSWGKDG